MKAERKQQFFLVLIFLKFVSLKVYLGEKEKKKEKKVKKVNKKIFLNVKLCSSNYYTA